MKNYLSLSNLSQTFTQIVPCLQSKKAKKVKKSLPFVVLNSDNDYGFYMRRLVKEIKKYAELTEQPKILRKKSLKNIETGDLLVFGDCLGNVGYDYRVETNHRSLDHLDGRSFKVYDIINDFDKVIKRLKKYVAENNGEFLLVEDNDEPEVRVTEIQIDVNVHKRSPKSVIPIAILRNDVCEEKVTIFDNWVKVGYNQYDIYVDLFGREIVYIDGSKFYVKEDRFGRKYLSK
jgi:hypothetical protein